MTEGTPTLHQLNIVAGDLDVTLVFYGQLGLRIPEGASRRSSRDAAPR
jgi:hypothetical protein